MFYEEISLYGGDIDIFGVAYTCPDFYHKGFKVDLSRFLQGYRIVLEMEDIVQLTFYWSSKVVDAKLFNKLEKAFGCMSKPQSPSHLENAVGSAKQVINEVLLPCIDSGMWLKILDVCKNVSEQKAKNELRQNLRNLLMFE